ncbi:MAG: hypothetical protein KAT85_07150, partial [candidate division Zixibacteria bacterium]|nr:hypothetical protein [candidate division Zixibacteria bacterium]
PWIICQPNTGQNFDSVLVFIDPGSIPPVPDPAPGDTVILGAYLTIEAPGADNSPQWVGVTFFQHCVPEDYALAVHPRSFAYTASQNHTFEDWLHVWEVHGDTIEFELYNSSNWLSLPMYFVPPTTPDSVPIVVNTDGLGPGVYHDTILVFALVETPNSPLHVPVTLAVTDSGYVLATDPTSFEFTLSPSDSVVVESLYVYETGGASINFWTHNNSYWLYVDTMSASPLYTPTSIFLVVNAGGLSPGVYTDSVFISAYEASPIAVPVTLTVEGSGGDYIVETIPDHFNFTVSPGHTLSDIGMIVFEETGLSVPFWVQIAGGSSWLQVHPPDSLDPGWETPDSVYFDIVTGDLPPGVYTDTLIVFNPLDNDTLWYDPVLVPVTVMIVGGDYALLPIPESFNFTLSPGDSLIGQLLYIYEASGESIGFWTHNRSDWLYVDTMSASPMVTPDSVFLSVYANTFSPGIYFDTVFVMAYEAATLAVPVTLVVEGEPPDYIVGTAPTWFNLSVEQGGSAFDSLHVFEIHGYSVTFIFYSNEPWLVLDPHWAWIPPYFTPMTLMFLVNAAELAPGSYIDTIFIDPEPAFDTLMFPPVAVPVHITVHPDWPSVRAVPDHFVLTVPEGGSISNIGMWVYEEHGDSVVFFA